MQSDKQIHTKSNAALNDGVQINIMTAQATPYELFSGLYDQYSAALFGFITRILGPGELAEQVLQKTFIIIYHTRLTYDSCKEHHIAWMLKKALHTSLNAIPATGTEETSALAHAGITDVKCIGQAIMLLYFKGYTFDQVAEHLGLPESLLIVKIKRGFQQLEGGSAA